MASTTISIHQVKVFTRVRHNGEQWETAKDIAANAKVGIRVTRHHCLALTTAGVFERAHVFPEHRYRLNPTAPKAARGHLARLEEAAKVFGLGKEVAS